MICSYCGTSNPNPTAFCRNCGRPLRTTQRDGTPALYYSPQPQARSIPSPRFPSGQPQPEFIPSGPVQPFPRNTLSPGQALLPATSSARASQPSRVSTPARASARKNGAPAWLLLLVSGILLMALIVGGTMFFLNHSFANSTDPVVQSLTNYCGALQKSDYQSAWSLWSSRMHNQMKESDYAYSWQLKGKITSCTVNATTTNSSSCASSICTGTITYFLNDGHSTHSVTDTLQLINENDQWKIQSENSSS